MSFLTVLAVLGLSAPAAGQDPAGPVREGDTIQLPVPLGATFVATEAETATAGEDFTALNGPPNGPQQTVTTLEDAKPEEAETFLVRFSTGPPPLGSAVRTYRVTIGDDEPTLEISSVSVAEGEGGALLGLVASAPTENPVSVAYAVAGGSATPGTDFDGKAGRVEIAQGQPGALIGIPITKDDVDEEDETFTVRLSDPTGATIKTGEATVTIRNDDLRAITIGDATVTEGDGENAVARLPVTLSGPTFRTVTVAFGTLDATARAPLDYLARLGTLTFTPGQTATTIELAVVSDDRREPTEVFGVLLAPPSGATLARGGAVVTVRDDDAVSATADSRADDATPPAMRLTRPVLRGRAVSVKVTCPRAETRCVGRLTLYTVPDRKARARSLRRERRIGLRRFTLRGGQARTLRVTIPRTILAAARASGRLRVRAYSVVSDAADNVDTGEAGATLRFRRSR